MEPKPLLNKILCASSQWIRKQNTMGVNPQKIKITKEENFTTTFSIMMMRG
jgi:hypothetical protein